MSWIAAGLYVGALLYEILEPILSVILMGVRAPLDLIVEWVCYVTTLIGCALIGCLISRTILRLVAELLYELGGPTVAIVSVLVPVTAAIAAAGICLYPADSESLDIAAGLVGLITLSSALVAVWRYVRYDWPGNPRRKRYDTDVGLALSYIRDGRRARLRG